MKRRTKILLSVCGALAAAWRAAAAAGTAVLDDLGPALARFYGTLDADQRERLDRWTGHPR